MFRFTVFLFSISRKESLVSSHHIFIVSKHQQNFSIPATTKIPSLYSFDCNICLVKPHIDDTYFTIATDLLLKLPSDHPGVRAVDQIYNGVFRVEHVNKKYWEIALKLSALRILKLYPDISINQFKARFDQYLEWIVFCMAEDHSYHKEYIEESIQLVFEVTAESTIQKGYFFGIQPICRHSAANELIDKLIRENPNEQRCDVKSVMSNQLKLVETEKFPLGIFHEDFLGIWVICNTWDYTCQEIDSDFMLNYGRTPSQSWLFDRYMEFLPLRKFEVFATYIPVIEKLEDSDYQIDFIFSFGGIKLTELTFINYALKSFLYSYYQWVDVPEGFIPSLDDDYFIIVVDENAFFISTTGKGIRERLISLLDYQKSKVGDPQATFGKARFLDYELLKLINLRQSDYCKLNIDFTIPP